MGNVILKLYEGVSGSLIKKIKGGMMKNLRSKIGALLIKPALKETLKDFDTTKYGGAPLLGLKGLVVKTHGSAKAVEIKNAVFQCVQFKQQKINEKIAERIQPPAKPGRPIRRINRKRERFMDQLEQKIGYRFRNKKLLRQALTHSSYANEKSSEAGL
mgnify:CR=1 FL=1